MKRKPRWTLEMLTASLAVLCGLLLLVLLVQRPTAWLLLAVLVVLWGIGATLFRCKLRRWVVRWTSGTTFEKSKVQFSLDPLSQPAALLSGETVLWYNSQFRTRLLGGQDVLASRVQKLLPGFAGSAVLDADGLNAAAQLLAEGKTLPHPAGELIVTPHPGEMARLTGLSVAQINADRENTACQYAEKWNAVVVLKGCRTVVAAPDGRVCTNPTGNPGLARGGSGDVLAGMTAALLACGLPAYEAAACAVYLHGAAADRAAAALGEYGMLPHDILSQLGRIFAENHR